MHAKRWEKHLRWKCRPVVGRMQHHLALSMGQLVRLWTNLQSKSMGRSLMLGTVEGIPLRANDLPVGET